MWDKPCLICVSEHTKPRTRDDWHEEVDRRIKLAEHAAQEFITNNVSGLSAKPKLLTPSCFKKVACHENVGVRLVPQIWSWTLLHTPVTSPPLWVGRLLLAAVDRAPLEGLHRLKVDHMVRVSAMGMLFLHVSLSLTLVFCLLLSGAALPSVSARYRYLEVWSPADVGRNYFTRPRQSTGGAKWCLPRKPACFNFKIILSESYCRLFGFWDKLCTMVSHGSHLWCPQSQVPGLFLAEAAAPDHPTKLDL